ncbi:pectinesterase family protein [Flectobacillus sp. DC10W]|uniref:Pectinesterase family protein n=1 Tax=Flectobacillus longus TaxID=2984207 RepID=A0ABT6YR48_9BACT|nr:pectinesterase family protein [Flectobacillus longus]MDI9865646.1 pectinesterase family protein [Flectobacillus longus]
MKKSLISMLLFFLSLSVAIAQKTTTYPTKFTVALDGSGDFKSIQEAIMAFRDHSQQRVVLFIKNGTYHEKVTIPANKPNLHLIGESREGVVITNGDYSGKTYSNGQKDAVGKTQFSTYNSYTLLVDAPDIILENLTIVNSAGRVGQAVALHVEGDRFVCKNCTLLGNQDTLYAAREGTRQYYVNCQIEGTTDYLFGKAIVVFQSCILKSLSDSYITAAATPDYQPYGFVFFDCKLTADSTAKKVFLGRPWRPACKTVFIRTEMGSHILPIGWNNWGNSANEKTVLYAEYQSTGEGANSTKRATWSRQLSKKELRNYTLENIFGTKEQITNWWN